MSKKKDPDSWKGRGVKYRDARHDKSFDGPTGPKKKKKDTKKWCKGIEGREHNLEWRDAKYPALNFNKKGEIIFDLKTPKDAVCKNCGKRVGWTKNQDLMKQDPNTIKW